MIGLRNLTQALQLATGVHTRVPQEGRGATVKTYDSHGPILPIHKAKAYTRPRDVSSVDLIVIHCTAVKGGFGVSRSRVAYWEREINLGSVPKIVCENFDARRLALWERFKDVPYHHVALRTGESLWNHPLERHTWHGNAGNRGIGFAVDCASGEQLTAWEIGAARFALLEAIEHLRSQTQRETIYLQPHRNFSRQRLADPGALVWSEIVEPLAETLDGVAIDYNLHEADGRPIPDDWRV